MPLQGGFLSFWGCANTLVLVGGLYCTYTLDNQKIHSVYFPLGMTNMLFLSLLVFSFGTFNHWIINPSTKKNNCHGHKNDLRMSLLFTCQFRHSGSLHAWWNPVETSGPNPGLVKSGCIPINFSRASAAYGERCSPLKFHRTSDFGPVRLKCPTVNEGVTGSSKSMPENH